jgi:hypothetical protein
MLGLVSYVYYFPFTISNDPARNNPEAKLFKDKISHILQQHFPGSWFHSQQRQEIPVFSRECRPDLGPTQPTIQRVSEYPSLGVKRPGRETDSI